MADTRQPHPSFSSFAFTTIGRNSLLSRISDKILETPAVDATEDDEDDMYVDIDIDPDSDTGTTEPPDTRPNLLERIGEPTHSTNPFDGAFFQPNGTYVPLAGPVQSESVLSTKTNPGNVVPNQPAILEQSPLLVGSEENCTGSPHQPYSFASKSPSVHAHVGLPTPPPSGSCSNFSSSLCPNTPIHSLSDSFTEPLSPSLSLVRLVQEERNAWSEVLQAKEARVKTSFLQPLRNPNGQLEFVSHAGEDKPGVLDSSDALPRTPFSRAPPRGKFATGVAISPGELSLVNANPALPHVPGDSVVDNTQPRKIVPDGSIQACLNAPLQISKGGGSRTPQDTNRNRMPSERSSAQSVNSSNLSSPREDELKNLLKARACHSTNSPQTPDKRTSSVHSRANSFASRHENDQVSLERVSGNDSILAIKRPALASGVRDTSPSSCQQHTGNNVPPPSVPAGIAVPCEVPPFPLDHATVEQSPKCFELANKVTGESPSALSRRSPRPPVSGSADVHPAATIASLHRRVVPPTSSVQRNLKDAENTATTVKTEENDNALFFPSSNVFTRAKKEEEDVKIRFKSEDRDIKPLIKDEPVFPTLGETARTDDEGAGIPNGNLQQAPEGKQVPPPLIPREAEAHEPGCRQMRAREADSEPVSGADPEHGCGQMYIRPAEGERSTDGMGREQVDMRGERNHDGLATVEEASVPQNSTSVEQVSPFVSTQRLQPHLPSERVSAYNTDAGRVYCDSSKGVSKDVPSLASPRISTKDPPRTLRLPDDGISHSSPGLPRGASGSIQEVSRSLRTTRQRSRSRDRPLHLSDHWSPRHPEPRSPPPARARPIADCYRPATPQLREREARRFRDDFRDERGDDSFSLRHPRRCRRSLSPAFRGGSFSPRRSDGDYRGISPPRHNPQAFNRLPASYPNARAMIPDPSNLDGGLAYDVAQGLHSRVASPPAGRTDGNQPEPSRIVPGGHRARNVQGHSNAMGQPKSLSERVCPPSAGTTQTATDQHISSTLGAGTAKGVYERLHIPPDHRRADRNFGSSNQTGFAKKSWNRSVDDRLPIHRAPEHMRNDPSTKAVDIYTPHERLESDNSSTRRDSARMTLGPRNTGHGTEHSSVPSRTIPILDRLSAPSPSLREQGVGKRTQVEQNDSRLLSEKHYGTSASDTEKENVNSRSLAQRITNDSTHHISTEDVSASDTISSPVPLPSLSSRLRHTSAKGGTEHPKNRAELGSRISSTKATSHQLKHPLPPKPTSLRGPDTGEEPASDIHSTSDPPVLLKRMRSLESDNRDAARPVKQLRGDRGQGINGREYSPRPPSVNASPSSKRPLEDRLS